MLGTSGKGFLRFSSLQMPLSVSVGMGKRKWYGGLFFDILGAPEGCNDEQ